MKKFLISLILIIALLFVSLNLPVWPGLDLSQADYSTWMSDNLQGSERVIDLALLGAHDALSSDIGLSSRIDYSSASSLQTGLVGQLIRGFSVRQSRTQVSRTGQLLRQGVRYFDVRISYDSASDTWYSSHNYLSRPLIDDLNQLTDFLSHHPGELVVFDFQHIHGIEYDTASHILSDLNQLLDEAGLGQYVVPNDLAPLEKLTFHQATQGKTRAGLMVLSKIKPEDKRWWDYGPAIRSAWPNQDEPVAIYQFLSDEAELIQAGQALTGNQMAGYTGRNAKDGFRIMQAVLTMQLNRSGIVRAITGWSLLHRAKWFNHELLEQPGFDDWLSAMPIVMVDFCNSEQGNFHNRVMERIIQYNQTLRPPSHQN